MGGYSSKDGPLVKVNLGRINRSISVSGEGLTVKGAFGGGIGKFDARRGITLAARGRSLYIDKKYVSTPISVAAKQVLYLDREAYRGQFLIIGGSPPAVINVVPLEQYLRGVVGNEVSYAWPRAALETQAILARTYTIHKTLQRREREAAGIMYDMEKTIEDQVYGGVKSEKPQIDQAVYYTRGKILAYHGRAIKGLYHACCGGKTELQSYVWGGNGEEYERSVKCNYCVDAPYYFWRFPQLGSLSGWDMARALGLSGEVKKVDDFKRSPTGRIISLEASNGLRSTRFNGDQFRKALGYTNVKSALFNLEKDKSGFVFLGSGYGHGVGLCQWGAKGMADKGYATKAILKFYMPGTDIKDY